MKRYILPVLLLLMAATAAAQPYAYSIMRGDEPGELARVNLATGEVTSLAELGLSRVAGMTMAADGDLLLIHWPTHDLRRVDPQTAEVETIGPLGVEVDLQAGGLTMDACGGLWLATHQQLYQVDDETGAATQVAELSEEVVGLTSDGTDLLGLVPGRLARVQRDGLVEPYGDAIVNSPLLALDFDEQGGLWAVWWYETVIIPSNLSKIYEFDPETGDLLSTQDGFFISRPGNNMAISPPRGVCPAVAVPAAHGVSLALFGALLAVLAVRRL